MKPILISFFLLLVIFILTGCGGETTLSNQQEKLIQLTPEEWNEISEAESNCRSLDYFDALGGDSIMDCEKDQLGSLWDKFEKYNSVEQQKLRTETSQQEQAKAEEEAKANLEASVKAVGLTVEEAKVILNKISEDAPLDECLNERKECLMAAWELAFKKGIPEGKEVICGLILREELKPLCKSGTAKSLSELEESFTKGKELPKSKSVW